MVCVGNYNNRNCIHVVRQKGGERGEGREGREGGKVR